MTDALPHIPDLGVRKPKPSFAGYHITHRVECKGRTWSVVRELRDGAGKLMHFDAKECPSRGAALEFMRADADRIAGEMYTQRYSRELIADGLRRDSEACIAEAKALEDKALVFDVQAQRQRESLVETKRRAEGLPARASVSGKLRYEGKIVDEASVPAHRRVFADDVENADSFLERVPEIEKRVLAAFAEAAALRASAAKAQERGQRLAETAADQARAARARGDACANAQKGKPWIYSPTP